LQNNNFFFVFMHDEIFTALYEVGVAITAIAAAAAPAAAPATAPAAAPAAAPATAPLLLKNKFCLYRLFFLF
jgi:hypothetical protein